jgi:hypothetical protein
MEKMHFHAAGIDIGSRKVFVGLGMGLYAPLKPSRATL